MESAIYLTLSVNIDSALKNDLFICRDYHIQPSEIKQLPYWQYETILSYIDEIQKEEEKRQKEREKEQQNTFKAPSYQMPKMPTISIPKF